MAAGDLTKIKLSGSTDGKNIKIAATATAGTLVHTAHATDLDEIYINACIPGATAKWITVEWGEATDPDGLTKLTIPAAVGWVPVVEGKLLTNSLVVRIFAETTNLVMVDGYVLRHGQ